jgi:hypothetical protein
VAAPSKPKVCGRSLAGMLGSNPASGMSVCLSVCLSVLSVMCCQVEAPTTGRSLVQRSPTECGVSECDREASKLRRPRLTTAVKP